MNIGENIWNELGPLASIVELIDHDNGTVRFRGGTQAERDAVAAIIAAHNPQTKSSETLQKEADASEHASAKLSPVIQYLVTHTNAEIRQFVQGEVNADGVTNLATAQAALKKIETLLGHLAVAEAVNARKTLR